MTDNDRIYTTKLYLEKLAQGIDPTTGEDVADDSTLNNVFLCRAFSLAADIIGEYIANGCKIGVERNRPIYPFAITLAQKSVIVMSDTPVSISVISKRVESVLDKNVQPISAVKMAQWLEAQGLLKTIVDERGKRARIATEEGNRLGINTKKEDRHGEMIVKNYYDLNAQAYVIANLEEIAVYTDGSLRYGKEEAPPEPEASAEPEKKKSKAKKS
ncbi:MAG: hypothetical protein IKT04_03715 [Clostridia bacterium]|nr:hypothetical protein [Clostridia bacterium]